MMSLKRLKKKKNELVKKVNNINTTDTSNFLKKTDYNTKIEMMKLKKKLLIMIIIIRILLHKNIIS